MLYIVLYYKILYCSNTSPCDCHDDVLCKFVIQIPYFILPGDMEQVNFIFFQLNVQFWDHTSRYAKNIKGVQ